MDTVNMSVKEIRELLASLPGTDIDLACRLTRDPRSTVRNMGYRALGRRRSLAANEELFRGDGAVYVAGADEAGRGALAGPLVAAATVFDPGVSIKGVNDSKLLTPEQREELYSKIIAKARGICVVAVDSGLIDRMGLQVMNMKALAEALRGLPEACDVAICDHFPLRGLPFRVYGIPHGDEIFHSVAAASIVAKVERDRMMRALGRRFPRFGFENNKGYSSEAHWEALGDAGPCEIHRMSFSGVRPDADELPLWEEDDGD